MSEKQHTYTHEDHASYLHENRNFFIELAGKAALGEVTVEDIAKLFEIHQRFEEIVRSETLDESTNTTLKQVNERTLGIIASALNQCAFLPNGRKS